MTSMFFLIVRRHRSTFSVTKRDRLSLGNRNYDEKGFFKSRSMFSQGDEYCLPMKIDSFALMITGCQLGDARPKPRLSTCMRIHRRGALPLPSAD
ncbi:MULTISPECIES: hypothetical protein [unclassified Caballeronia]|uniref:hypothetical protein n=1 Tax=unclassified Caballeronia TaxID=2646786 RepID=UPI002863B20B|nr:MULTISPECIES: hypothetical protein [unclassified Caballeronia]MDR5815599.1 hypothetical protein [Caballeronia sp. LZ033]MDR5822172.1 hypothetical protein [Caballeronia sp. LZ043]